MPSSPLHLFLFLFLWWEKDKWDFSWSTSFFGVFLCALLLSYHLHVIRQQQNRSCYKLDLWEVVKYLLRMTLFLHRLGVPVYERGNFRMAGHNKLFVLKTELKKKKKRGGGWHQNLALKKQKKKSVLVVLHWLRIDNEMFDKHDVKIIKMSTLGHLEDTISPAISNKIKPWMPH